MGLFKRVFTPSLVALALACAAPAAAAQKKGAGRKGAAGKRAADASRHSQEAAEVLRKVMSVPEKEIPRDLLESAEAVAVCPGVLKAAFIVGGRKGDCVISRRTLKRQWSTPVFYNLAGGSVGAQVGGSKTDYVLLFMNEVALKGVAITPDNDLNEAFYGKKASELIRGREDMAVPTQVRALPLALARYS